MTSIVKTKRKTAPIDELAARLGIENEYRDAHGKKQGTPMETKRALLLAMGVLATDDAQARAALNDLEDFDWARVLHPVYVVCADARPFTVALTLPAGIGEVAWSLMLENGGQKSGKAKTQDLALIAQRTIDGKAKERRKLSLDEEIPWGYHQLRVDLGQSEAALIVTPSQCWLPDSVSLGRRLWGLAAQLYSVRSETNWGIGDFGDLRRMATSVGTIGADVLGLNPLHAMFPDNPEHASPYSPASRLLLNVLYIDVTAVPGLANCVEAQELIQSHEFRTKLDNCRSVPLVNYSSVSALKLRPLRILFDHWNSVGLDRDNSFAAFCRLGGEVLRRGCVFQCLRQIFVARDPALGDWRQWPEEYREPTSPATARFAEEHHDEVNFMAWLQWLADAQLAAAAEAAKPMEIGLYRDVAVGADMWGVETWSNQAAVVSGAHIGAPPDIFNPAGQDWGLPPFHPRALREQRYQSFIELIRANMRHAGALRIDHVMSLQHLYWVPEAHSTRDGAYVRYEMEDLIGILALESHRHRCIVVGEDLGTVPDGFRERMAEANILSYRVLFFEQTTKSGVFRKPKDYPALSVAVASNHDLPTVRAWWEGADIELRDRLKLYPDDMEVKFQRQLRERDRDQVRRALEKQGFIRESDELDSERLVLLVHEYLARSNSFMAAIQIDDVTEEIDPVNVPGSTEQYPNWRRKLSLTFEEIFEHPRLKAIARIFAEERGLPDRLV
jgi:4-alpha-glucanotransferase